MKTAVGVSLLVVGLVVGVALSALFSLGTILNPSPNSTSVVTVVSTAVEIYSVTATTTVAVAVTPGRTLQTISQPQSATTFSNPIRSASSAAIPTPTQSNSSLVTTSSSNVTLSGPVTVEAYNGTPTTVVLISPSGEDYTFPALGGQEISASVPNNMTYTVVVYFVTSNGGSSSCTVAQPLYVYSQNPVMAVDISC